MKAFVATVAIATLTLAACGGDDSGGGDTTEAPSGGGTSAPADLSSYEDVASLNESLAAGGIECNLEYEGLDDGSKEQSLCTIANGQAVLTVYHDLDLLAQFLDTDPEAVAYGENWTVELTAAAAAADVAEAAGGATTGG